MTAYILVLREGPLHDPDAYAEYQRLTRASPDGGGPRPTPLVLYGAMQPLEGEAPDGMVLLQFETVEDARTWYESPGYQAALPHRIRAGKHRAFIVEGFAGMPG